MCEVLIEGSSSKSLVLAEYSVSQLVLFVSCTSPDFFKSCDSLINAMCLIIEGKKTRMVKKAVPVLLEIRTHLGKEGLFDRAVVVLSSEVGPEEQKDNSPS